MTTMAKAKKGMKAPVTERALVQRVNRALKKNEQAVKKSRAFVDEKGFEHYETSIGKYYTIDFSTNCVVDTHVDIEDLGRELKVLAEWETLAE